MSEKDTFVSRHGRRTALSDNELKGMLDDEPIKNKPKKLSRPKIRRSLSRRQWLIVTGVIVVVVAIPVIVGEVLTAEYVASTNSAKTHIKSLVSQTILPVQKKASVEASVIADIASKTEAIRDQTCPGGVFDNMANLYPRAKSAYDNCITERSNVAQVANSLRDMEKEALYLQTISPMLKPLLQNGSGEFAVISSQQSNWQDFQTKLKDLSPPTNFANAHTALLLAVKQVADGWSALNTASNAKNTKDFTGAQATLAKSYQAVRDTTSGFDHALTDTQQALSQNAARL